MSEIVISLPESISQKLSEIEAREGITKEQFIHAAIREKLDACLSEAYLNEKASRGNREAFLKVLNAAPDTEPEEYDKL
jgi:metal-responsive CopG/Arc/MetJ family transcriptional regulator